LKRSRRRRRRRRRRRKMMTMTTTTTTTSEPQQKSKHRLQQVEDYHPGDRLKDGTHIDPSVSPAKGVKKVRLHTSTKTAHHCLC
jgi:hypothetical protein